MQHQRLAKTAIIVIKHVHFTLTHCCYRANILVHKAAAIKLCNLFFLYTFC